MKSQHQEIALYIHNALEMLQASRILLETTSTLSLALPLEWRIDNRPRVLHGGQHIQRLPDHCTVGLGVVCRAQRSPQGKTNK